MDLSITNHAAKSLSWSGPNRNLANWCNYPEVKIDGYYVSDIRYCDIWHTCHSLAYCPEQMVGWQVRCKVNHNGFLFPVLAQAGTTITSFYISCYSVGIWCLCKHRAMPQLLIIEENRDGPISSGSA